MNWLLWMVIPLVIVVVVIEYKSVGKSLDKQIKKNSVD